MRDDAESESPYAVPLDELEASAYVPPEEMVATAPARATPEVIAEERALRERMLRFAGG